MHIPKKYTKKRQLLVLEECQFGFQEGCTGGGGVLCLPLIPPLSYVSLYTLYQMSLYAYSITVISGWRCPIIYYVNVSHAPTSLVQYLCSLFSLPLIWIHGTPWQTFAPRHQLKLYLDAARCENLYIHATLTLMILKYSLQIKSEKDMFMYTSKKFSDES